MLLFDTGKKLEKAFTQEQFDALVEVLEARRDWNATKEDVKDVKEDLKALELRLNAALRESELRTQMEIEKIRADIQASKVETLKWVVGLLMAQTAAIIAAVAALLRIMG